MTLTPEERADLNQARRIVKVYTELIAVNQALDLPCASLMESVQRMRKVIADLEAKLRAPEA